MSQSTPLSQLQKPQPSVPQEPIQTNEPSIEDMLKDMDVPQGPTSNMNTEQFNYSVDQSQVPPPKMPENLLENTTVPSEPNSNNTNTVDTKKEQINKIPFLNIELKSGGILSKCVSSGKSALVVFVLVLLVSLPQINRLVFTKIPNMLSESGEIKIQGVVLKGVVCAVLFMIINMFL